MSITINRLVEIANEVAGVARERIPRSSNRFLDTDAENSDWLKDSTEIEYTDFIQTFVRTGTKGPGQVAIKERTKEPVFCAGNSSSSDSILPPRELTALPRGPSSHRAADAWAWIVGSLFANASMSTLEALVDRRLGAA